MQNSGSAYFSFQLTASSEIQALSKLFLHFERQLLVLRLETSHHNKQRLAWYGNLHLPPANLVLVFGKSLINECLNLLRKLSMATFLYIVMASKESSHLRRIFSLRNWNICCTTTAEHIEMFGWTIICNKNMIALHATQRTFFKQCLS